MVISYQIYGIFRPMWKLVYSLYVCTSRLITKAFEPPKTLIPLYALGWGKCNYTERLWVRYGLCYSDMSISLHCGNKIYIDLLLLQIISFYKEQPSTGIAYIMILWHVHLDITVWIEEHKNNSYNYTCTS